MLPRLTSRFGTYSMVRAWRSRAPLLYHSGQGVIELTLVSLRFTARLRGLEPHEPCYIEVPRFVMRRLAWGRYVRVLARINDKHEMPATIMNVGWGPSFLIPANACKRAGVCVNESVEIVLREL
jgi:hypothetical protein